MKTIRTWVLIADGSRAEILENRGRGTGIRALDGLSFEHASDPAHELGRDRPTRSYDSVGHGRHANEPKTNPHDEQKHDFARILVAELERAHANKAFDQLVLVAPPTFLGTLRKELPKNVAALVTSEIAKDLTKTPVIELPSHLGDAVTL